MGSWNGKKWREPLSHGRRYTEEELWDNYTYFIRKVVPVAEESGVYIGIHPDDPPVYALGGIPRCIFGTFAGYQRRSGNRQQRAISACASASAAGWRAARAWVRTCWKRSVSSPGARQLFKVHLRNVSAPLPEGFVETFLDDGYMNMSRIMRTLHESAIQRGGDLRPRTRHGGRSMVVPRRSLWATPKD